MNDNDAEPVGVREALIRLSALVRTKNLAIVEEFAAGGMLVGSGAGEMARGEDELRAFWAALFAAPYGVSWNWDSVEMAASGRVAWLFAEGSVVLVDEAGERPRPYRLSGVLEAAGAGWKWRLFHGSEPAAG